MRNVLNSCCKQKRQLQIPTMNGITQFENHHLTIQFPTTLLRFIQSWHFNSPITQKIKIKNSKTFLHGEAIEIFWNEIEKFFWNLSRLFMIQKWLLQKKDWKRFQMNKFSCFFMLFWETQFRRFFTQLGENVSSHVLALQRVKTVYSDSANSSERNSKWEKNLLKRQNRKLKKQKGLKLNNFSLSLSSFVFINKLRCELSELHESMFHLLPHHHHRAAWNSSTLFFISPLDPSWHCFPSISIASSLAGLTTI